MYISLNWIKDYVNLDGIDLKELINKFTLSCAEVEGVEEKGVNLSGVVTAKILSVNEHPNSKKLHLLKVDAGTEVLDIVCGAPNVREGLIVPLAKIGANVNGINIDKAKVGGYDSYGMCCSAKELGISDDHSGLFEFEENTKIGVDVKEILDIDDIVFEVDNKSLTNRPDMWGHYGIAREISALTGRELKPLQIYDGNGEGDNLDIKVNSKTCNRYTGVTMANITKNISPVNMQIRLYYAGMRGINLLADITNYIMLELGQPMHAFDNNLVKSIEVSDLAEDTKFVTLDNTERVLPKNTMVIKSNNEVVAVAGVMGGLDSEIVDTTNSVLIESANFDAYSVRRTAINLGLRTESSSRYEKSLDPEMTMLALKRYMYLVKEIDNGAIITSSITDIYNNNYDKITIEIDKNFIDRYIGIDIPMDKIKHILTSLQFVVTDLGDNKLSVDVPSFRATKDISNKADLVEEISRIYGYDNIDPQSTLQEVEPVKLNPFIEHEYNIKYALASRYNLNEIHSYVWYDYETNKQLGIDPKSAIRIVNSLQKDNDKIRSTMVPTLLKVALDNKNQLNNFGIFEIGKVVQSVNKENNLVNENASLGILLYNKNADESSMLMELKNMVEYVALNVVKTAIKFVPATPDDNYISPANYYEIKSNENTLGFIGMVHPKTKNNIEKGCSIVVAEVDFDKLIAQEKVETTFEKISKYPKTELDFNFLIEKDKHYSEIEHIATSIESELSYKVSLIDIFEKPEDEYKSYTLRYILESFDRNITANDIETFHSTVIETFKQNNINLKM